MNKEDKRTAFAKIQDFFSGLNVNVKIEEEVNRSERLVAFAKDKETNLVEKFEEVNLLGGGMVMIEPAVEAGAYIAAQTPEGEWIPAPPANYELEDGRIVIVVAEGVVDAVEEVAAEGEAPVVEEEMGETSNAKRVIESIVKEQIFALEERLNKQDQTIKFLTESLENRVVAETELKGEFTKVIEFTKENFEKLYSEPIKEPVVKTKNPLRREEKNIFLKQK